jgi:hypothetical protein
MRGGEVPDSGTKLAKPAVCNVFEGGVMPYSPTHAGGAVQFGTQWQIGAVWGW